MLPFIYFTVKGHSMSPAFTEGDKVWINRWAYLIKKPREGDVVVVQSPLEDMLVLKRIKRIRGNKYFLEGDNKKHSTDSRKFGWIKKKDIIGKVV